MISLIRLLFFDFFVHSPLLLNALTRMYLFCRIIYSAVGFIKLYYFTYTYCTLCSFLIMKNKRVRCFEFNLIFNILASAGLPRHVKTYSTILVNML